MSDTIIAGLSLLVSATNAVLYFRLQGKYNEMTKTQTSTAQGAIETQVRNSISDATKEVLHYATEVEKNPSSKDRHISQRKKCIEMLMKMHVQNI